MTFVTLQSGQTEAEQHHLHVLSLVVSSASEALRLMEEIVHHSRGREYGRVKKVEDYLYQQ